MTVYDKFLSRERTLWTPFAHAMRFSAEQVTERAIIFGLFSGAYQNGMDYLRAIDAFELALIVDTYNQQMAGLDADEQNFIIDIATRRYIANVDRLIHDAGLVSKREEIEAQDAEWDAKFEALSADQAALLTLNARYSAKSKEIAARIMVLQAQILEEQAQFELEALEIEKKALEVARAETELAGKDVDILRIDLEILEKENLIAQKRNQLAGKEIDLAGKDLDIARIQLSESEAQMKITETGLDVIKIQLQIVEAGLKQLDFEKEAAQMKIQTAGYRSDIAKTALIEVDKAETQIERTLAGISLKETDVQLNDLDNELAKIDLQKKNIDLDYLQTDKEAAGVRVDIRQTEAKMAETPAIEAQLSQEQAEYAGEQAKLALYNAEVAVIESRETSIVAETSGAGQQLVDQAAVHAAELERLAVDGQFRIAQLEDQKTDTLTGFEERVNSAETQYEILEAKEGPLNSLADSDITSINYEENAIYQKYKAENDSLETIMTADILTTLTHSIGKA